MKLGLVDNAWWDSPVDPLRGVELTKQIGFDTYDLMTKKELSAPERIELRRKLAETGLQCSAMTCFAVSAADFNPAVRGFTGDWLKAQLELGYDMGCEMMVLALGEYSLEKQEIKPEHQWSWAVEVVRRVAEHAETMDMTIALEMVAHKFALLNSLDLARRFVADVNNPVMRINADLSHLSLNGDPPQSLERVRGLVSHVHISDCKGGVHGDLPPGRGDVPLVDYLKALKAIDFRGSVTAELEWCRLPEMIVDWVREAYQSTSRMMEELSIRS